MLKPSKPHSTAECPGAAGARRPERWVEGQGERRTAVLEVTAPASREERGEMRGAADCARGEQLLEVNGALVRGRSSKSPNTCCGH